MMECFGVLLFAVGIWFWLKRWTRIRSVSPEKCTALWKNLSSRAVTWIDRHFGQGAKKKLASLLAKAGHPKGGESRFLFQQVLLGALGTISGVILACCGFPVYLAILFGTLGAIWPRMRLNAVIRARQRAILLNLPYYLDLVTLALEAGLDLIAAVEEVIRYDRPNPLRDELRMTLNGLAMGDTRASGFATLAERTGLQPLSLLASAVAQSEELGASLGNLFRLQSESLRRELYRQAEEAAQRAPIKLLVPLIGLIFPVVFLLLFAPIALRFFGN